MKCQKNLKKKSTRISRHSMSQISFREKGIIVSHIKRQILMLQYDYLQDIFFYLFTQAS
jgi:hypothetical protein